MTAFFELKPDKILNYTYTLYPSYQFNTETTPFFSNGGRITASVFTLFENPTIQQRYFYDW